MNIDLPDPIHPQPYRVESYHKENRDTFTLTLIPRDGAETCHFLQGSSI